MVCGWPGKPAHLRIVFSETKVNRYRRFESPPSPPWSLASAEILRARFEAARIDGSVWAVPGCCKQNHLPKTDLSGPSLKRRESMARYGRFPTAVSKIICQKPTRKAHVWTGPFYNWFKAN